MDSSARVAQLAADFAFAVRAQNNAIADHDSVAGNAWALKYSAAAKELLKQDKEGLEAFSELLADTRIDVRTMAAAFLIPFKTEESKRVLEESAAGVTCQHWARE